MINKDYILRLAERFGRELSIILGLRKRNQGEEALIYIDDLLLRSIGLTSRFINSVPEEILIQMFSPLGKLEVETCLWAAVLLKSEGTIYEDMGNTKESYYRYLKSLGLFLSALRQEPTNVISEFSQMIKELLEKLDDYELPAATKGKLIAYYECEGLYDKAENILFDLLETSSNDKAIVEQGVDFYTRLLKKSNTDLQTGNLPREEVEDGLAQLQQMQHD